jgi:hypothetical protein
MHGKKLSRILIATRYLFPKKGIWLVRTFILFAFILFDYATTLAFCSHPIQEGNLLAREFMETYGIFLGLTIYDFITNLPIYMVLCLVSYTVNFPPRLSRIIEPCVDIAFAWFVAGAHFDGAASWFWPAPEMLRQAVGFGLYLIFARVLFIKTKSFTFNPFENETKVVDPIFQCVAK